MHWKIIENTALCYSTLYMEYNHLHSSTGHLQINVLSASSSIINVV